MRLVRQHYLVSLKLSPHIVRRHGEANLQRNPMRDPVNDIVGRADFKAKNEGLTKYFKLNLGSFELCVDEDGDPAVRLAVTEILDDSDDE